MLAPLHALGYDTLELFMPLYSCNALSGNSSEALSVASANDSKVAGDRWVASFAAMMRRGGAGDAWRSQPLGKMPHEGSFYPARLLST